MELFLMVACMGLLGLAVTALAFGAATRSDSEAQAREEVREPVAIVQPSRFFTDEKTPALATPAPIPIEALLLQLESHVRLEQAAAESFLQMPTSALLHSKTVSPFIH